MRYPLCFRFLLVFAALLLISGCGHKGPVKPLLKALPDAVQKLRVQQTGASMLLSWAAPVSNQDGSPLQGLDHFEIYRMTYNPDDDCPECRDTSSLLRTVDPDYLEDIQLVNNRYYLIDREDLEDNRGYQYRVIVISDNGYGGSHAQVRKPYYLPPTMSKELTTQGLDKQARLSWEAPATPDGMTLTGYRIYRGEEDAPLSPIPLNNKLVAETSYDDFGVINGKTYRYGVRAVFVRKDSELETGFTNLVQTTPGG